MAHIDEKYPQHEVAWRPLQNSIMAKTDGTLASVSYSCTMEHRLCRRRLDDDEEGHEKSFIRPQPLELRHALP